MIEQDIKCSISNNIIKNILEIHSCQRCKNKNNIPILYNNSFNITVINCSCCKDPLMNFSRCFFQIISGYHDKGIFYTFYNSIDMLENKIISYRIDCFSGVTCVSFYDSNVLIDDIKFENNSDDLILYSNEDILNLYENLIFS